MPGPQDPAAPPTQEPTIAQQADTFRSGLMELNELMSPMFEAAKGQREELERQGWSPTIAEQIAGMMLLHTVNMFFTNSMTGGQQ